MSNTKTEAQRLADWLDGFHKASVHHECAAELRRLDAALDAELANRDALDKMLTQCIAERDQLRAQLAKAVADERRAFEKWLGIKPCGAAHDFGWAAWQARAATAKGVK